jgi:hypothetical protein
VPSFGLNGTFEGVFVCESEATMVKRSALLVGLVLVSVVTVVVPALGQCVQFDDPADMFRLSEAVFLGTVQATEPTGATGFHIVMHRARFKIERVWKGRLKNVETLGTVEAFQPGQRYLVFASVAHIKSGNWEGGLQTSKECGWAEPEDAAERKLRWLSANAGKAAFRNPIIVVMADGVLLSAQGLERGGKRIPVQELSAALVALPVRAWPYGRVVWESDSGLRAADFSDTKDIERNHAAVVAALMKLGVFVEWLPSA